MDARLDPTAWGVTDGAGEPVVLRNSERALWNADRNSVTATIRYGDRAQVLKRDGEWTLLQSLHDDYIGWVKDARFDPVPDHAPMRVAVRSTHIYPEPNLKTPPKASLSLGARVCTFEQAENFTRVDEGWVFTEHLAGTENEPADWAQELLGTPYLWGGGTATGIDCSGLSQICFAMNGRDIPRDTDQQEATLTEVTFEDRQRNDLVYWPGHVAILADRDTMIHATAYKMATIAEPLADAIERIGQPSSIRRVNPN